ncbi:MAG: undecaprenyl-phosphate glucose phosphotransferase [Fluviibacter phosphoraccumulans]
MLANRGLLKEYASIWSALLQLVDLLVVAVSGMIAGELYLQPDQVFTRGYLQLLAVALLLAVIVFNKFGFYSAWRNSSLASEMRTVTVGWGAVMVALTLFFFLTKSGAEFSRVWAVLWFGLGLCGLLVVRVVLRQFLRWLRRKGYNQRKILIVGKEPLMGDLATRLSKAPWMGLSVVGRYTLVAEADVDSAALNAQINDLDVDQVWIALPLKAEPVVQGVITALSLSPVEIRYVPDLFGFRLFSHSVSEVAGLPVINLSSTPMEGFNRVVKEIEDRVLAMLILLLISPVLLCIAIGVKLSSPGPVFFRQQRNGWGGKPIHVLKFRSMVVHQEAAGAVTQASKLDTRITPFGAFLRQTSLDELPQFWNVLTGEMSIVGPRPHAVAHNDQYKVLVDDYMLRHRVKPGITGWAQVNGYRGETDTLDKMQKRVEYDLYYIEHWSLWLDLKIIVMTVFKGFVNKNAY